jgi:hypothetical protein
VEIHDDRAHHGAVYILLALLSSVFPIGDGTGGQELVVNNIQSLSSLRVQLRCLRTLDARCGGAQACGGSLNCIETPPLLIYLGQVVGSIIEMIDASLYNICDKRYLFTLGL